MSRAKEVAKSLLQTGAVKLNVKEPFTFVSGIKSPIYCDNRKIIGYSTERKVVVKEFVKKLSVGKKVIVIEDLISTGGSSIKAVEAARNEGAASVEVVAIFSYEFDKAFKNFADNNIPWESLSNFSALLELAREEKYLTEEEAEIASSWNKNTDTWGR